MEDDEKTHWYVMRDLKRANASLQIIGKGKN